MKKLTFLISVLLALPCVAFPQQSKNTQEVAPHLIHKRVRLKTHNYVPTDTSEDELVDRVMRMMDKSQTVFEGQLISKSPHSRRVTNPFSGKKFMGIYTVFTFKVFHWIKGSMRGNEVSFWNWGGRIGKAEYYVFPSAHYYQDFAGIFFLGNKKPNTQWINVGVMPIYAYNRLRTGEVLLGRNVVNPEYYVKVLKNTVSDSTAYRRFIHRLKRHEINDTLIRPHFNHEYMWTGHKWIRSREDTSKGGVK